LGTANAVWEAKQFLKNEKLGNYLKIQNSKIKNYRLLAGFDSNKDQSYFLYTLGQEELSRLLFPVGDILKTEARKTAAKLGLPSAERRESQDVCFIPDNDYRSFISRYVNPEHGDIVDTSGAILGKHDGLAYYTIGQRHKLGIASDKPLYVLKLLSGANRILVGNEEQLLTGTLTASRLTWIADRAPGLSFTATAKIRHRSPEVPVSVRIEGETASVSFEGLQRAVTPGQSIVFYQGEVVLGGGIINDSEDATNTDLC